MQAIGDSAPVTDVARVIDGLLIGMKTYHSQIVRDACVRTLDILLRQFNGRLDSAQKMIARLAPLLLEFECNELALNVVTRIVRNFGRYITKDDVTLLLGDTVLSAYHHKIGAVRKASHYLAASVIALDNVEASNCAILRLCGWLQGKADILTKPLAPAHVSRVCDELLADISVLRRVSKHNRSACATQLLATLHPYSPGVCAAPRLQLYIIQTSLELVAINSPEMLTITAQVAQNLQRQQTAVIVAVLRKLRVYIHPETAMITAKACPSLVTHHDVAVRLETALVLQQLSQFVNSQHCETELRSLISSSAMEMYVTLMTCVLIL